ncbi:hypothetical protein RUND412_005422 [Rhizina undulata]
MCTEVDSLPEPEAPLLNSDSPFFPPTSPASLSTNVKHDADTCIICLGELPREDHPIVGEYDMVARVLPCNHSMHNGCLKPWVERANSCPICRSPFNEVEVLATLTGHVMETYPVEDKIQVAAAASWVCEICIRSDNADDLSVCEICTRSFHVSCMGGRDTGLTMASGSWICHACVDYHQIHSNDSVQRVEITTFLPPRFSSGRTSGRHFGQFDFEAEERINRAWELAWERLDADLDSYSSEVADEEEEQSSQESRHEHFLNRRAQRQQERMDRRRAVAAAQHGARPNGFGQPMGWMFQTSRPRDFFPHTEEAMDEEEKSAWRMLEVAEKMEHSKKRSQPNTTPPSPERNEEARTYKRPRTKRDSEFNRNNTSSGESSSAGATASSPIIPAEGNSGGYLQSLIENIYKGPDSSIELGSSKYFSGLQPLSPEPSTAGSPMNRPASPNVTMPNNLTPNSPPGSRPHSPVGFYSPDVSFSPSSPPPNSPRSLSPAHQWQLSPPSPGMRGRQRIRPVGIGSLSSAERRLNTASPTTSNRMTTQHLSNASSNQSLSIKDKEDITSMVRQKLKPLYPAKITKEKFTEINMTISRKLYQMAMEQGVSCSDEAGKESLNKAAEEEVRVAVESL